MTKQCALIGLLSVLFLPSLLHAQAPQLINYQGRLIDGTNLVSGNVGLSLRLFDASTSGTLLYEDSNTVAVADGLYSTFIGDDTVSGTLAGALETTNIFIEVAVNGTALTPRERLVSAAYAVKAQQALVFTGSVLDAQLSSNIARLNGTNQTFGGPVAFTSVSNTFTGTFAGDGLGVTNVSMGSLAVDQAAVVVWGVFSDPTPASATDLVAVASAGNHILGLRANGLPLSWGDLPYSPSPGATGLIAVSAGNDHCMALRADGRVFAWGYGTDVLVPPHYGQSLVPASATGIVKIAAGGWHSLAVRSNGTVLAWGRNDSGQCNVPADATGVVAVAGGYFGSAVLRSDGRIVVWGSSSSGVTTVPPEATNVTAIAYGEHILALRSNGTIVAWGRNDEGQCNVPVSATGIVAISAGRRHSLALRADRTVLAWGSGSLGQTTVPSGIGADVLAIAAGGIHSVALRPPRAQPQLARLDAATVSFTGELGAASFAGDGAALTNIGSASLSAALQTNLAVRSGTNRFVGANTFTGTLTVTGTFLGSPPYIKVAETQAVGVAAGANVAGTNNFRELNAELADTHNLATLSGGNVTLPAGTYHCRISAPAYRVDENQARLRTSTGTVLIYGTSTYSDNTLSPGVLTYSLIDGQFTLASTATLQVQHYMKTVRSPNGLGLPANATWGDGAPYELYTVAEFWKIK